MVSLLGYLVLVASALLLSAAVGLITGYYPSSTFFTLALITFRVAEIHYSFVFAPPLVAVAAMILLSRTSINRRVVAGISVSSFYFLVTLMYLIVGAAEFSVATAIPWIAWAFLVGLGSSVIVDRLLARLRTPGRRTQ
ncbi:MAG: hypothetical protein CEE40_12675 [Chloroflexi bacterium B3_Chlor]|nr:MAG: hypothetical protein CEE40_12675 [Chloroflexi bacterium B3_Chlor]